MPLNTIETYLQQLLPGLGVNKMREITRLVYEITKRDGITPAQLFPAEKKTISRFITSASRENSTLSRKITSIFAQISDLSTIRAA